MAEAFLRHLAGDRFDVASAGTKKTQVRPEAIRAMEDKGISMKGHKSKTLEQFIGQQWDYVITVCDGANEACPVFPGGKKRLHWNFEDPSKVQGEKRQHAFNEVAEKIEKKLKTWLKEESE
jgi:arsenate reductase